MAYLGAMAALSLVGSRQFGGLNLIPDDWGIDTVVVGLVSLGFHRWGVLSGWATPSLEALRRTDPCDQL